MKSGGDKKVYELPTRQRTVDEIRADIDRERREDDLRALEPLEKRARERAEELRARGRRDESINRAEVRSALKVAAGHSFESGRKKLASKSAKETKPA